MVGWIRFPFPQIGHVLFIIFFYSFLLYLRTGIPVPTRYFHIRRCPCPWTGATSEAEIDTGTAYISTLHRISPIQSQPVFLLFLNALQRNSKYTFYGNWFDLTGVQNKGNNKITEERVPLVKQKLTPELHTSPHYTAKYFQGITIPKIQSENCNIATTEAGITHLPNTPPRGLWQVLWWISPIQSQPVFLLFLNALQRNSKYTFYGNWFDLTGVQNKGNCSNAVLGSAVDSKIWFNPPFL
jgi:hypothetical protein